VARLTQQILTNDFQRDAELVVKSDLPAESNVFHFNSERKKAFKADGFVHDTHNLTTEIREVIRMLLA
jgi:hypothetical protein